MNTKKITTYGSRSELPFKIRSLYTEITSLEVKLEILSPHISYDESLIIVKNVEGLYQLGILIARTNSKKVENCTEEQRAFRESNDGKNYGDEEIILLGCDLYEDVRKAISARCRLDTFECKSLSQFESYKKFFIDTAKIFQWSPNIPMLELFESKHIPYECVEHIKVLDDTFSVEYFAYTIEEGEEFFAEYRVYVGVGIGEVDGQYHLVLVPDNGGEALDEQYCSHTIEHSLVHFMPFPDIDSASSFKQKLVSRKEVFDRQYWTEVPPFGWPFSVKVKPYE